LIVGPGPFFNSRRVQMAQLAARYAVPAIHTTRLEAEAGGLMSYGPSLTDAYRQAGAYTGRILKGAKPEDLPVVQSSKFELVINLPPPRVPWSRLPEPLLAIADEVIECTGASSSRCAAGKRRRGRSRRARSRRERESYRPGFLGANASATGSQKRTFCMA